MARHAKAKIVRGFPNFSDKPTIKEAVVIGPKRTPRIRSITKAKTLTKEQFDSIIADIEKSDHAARNSAIFHLSFFACLRVQEIAGLQWTKHILDSRGKVSKEIHITRDIGKKLRARVIPTLDAPELRKALKRLRKERPDDIYCIYSLYGDRDGINTNALNQWMNRYYQKFGYLGCTSHSGRRTGLTGMAQRCNLEGASLLDVQQIAGHASIETTMGYIADSPHKSKLLGRVFE